MRSPQFSRRGMLLGPTMRRFTEQIIQRFSVAAARPGEGIATLSGGNLQEERLGVLMAGGKL